MCKYNGDDESMSRQLRLLAYVYEEMGLHEKALEGSLSDNMISH